VIRRYTWDLAALGGVPVTAYKIRCEGKVLNELTLFHVSERVDIGINLM
jgi:hypothetical protein